jgi:hypothetical protein
MSFFFRGALLGLLVAAIPLLAASQTCATIGHQCAGAPGRPAFTRIPCCNAKARCQVSTNPSRSGSFCVRVTDLCKGFRASRKEILDMTSSEWATYANALQTLRANGVYARFVQYHITFSQQAHGGCFFLPWHRQYLFEFERELNRVSPGISIPYWDWTKNSPRTGRAIYNAFTEDPIWDRAGGGNGASGPAPIPDLPFRNWFTDGRSATRDFVKNNGNRGGGGNGWTFSSSQQIARLSSGRDTYSSFSNVLELLHGTVHVAVGGTMSILTTSPTDPIFFSHHAYVDKIWRDWQLSGNGNAFGGTQPNPTRSCALNGERVTPPIFDRTVGQVMDDISPCTTYIRDSNAGPTSRFLVSDNDFTIRQSASAFVVSSSAENQTYQAEINKKKREEPDTYRSDVQEALNCIDSITRANRAIGLSEEYIQKGISLFGTLLYKLGIDAVKDKYVVGKSSAAIAQEGSSASSSKKSSTSSSSS